MTGEVKSISRTYRKIKGKYYRVRYKLNDGKPLDILRRNKSEIRSRHRLKLNY